MSWLFNSAKPFAANSFRSESNSIKYKRLLIDCPLTVLIAVCMISRVTFRRHVWFVLFYTGYSVHIILSNRIQDPTSLTGHISISTWGGSRLLFGLVTTWFPVFLPLPKPIPVPLRSPNQALSSATIQYWPITPNTISIRISVIARFWRQNTIRRCGHLEWNLRFIRQFPQGRCRSISELYHDKDLASMPWPVPTKARNRPGTPIFNWCLIGEIGKQTCSIPIWNERPIF